jgi:hypothetical protein
VRLIQPGCGTRCPRRGWAALSRHLQGERSMSTSAGTMLSFLRFRARWRGRAQRTSAPAPLTPGPPLFTPGPTSLASPEPPEAGLGILVRAPGRSAPTATMVANWPPAPCQPGQSTRQPNSPPARSVPQEPLGPASAPRRPQPTMLARSLPDASLLTPAATTPTVLVPVIRERAEPARPVQLAPSEGLETTTLPSRHDAPATTIHPRRTH